MISIKNLSSSYSQKRVINSLNLSLKENCIHGIVGMNGVGKTTLLNTIFGIKKPDEGTVLLNDKKLTKKQIAYLSAENFFYSNITGKEYLDLFKNTNFDTEKWNKLFQLPLNKIIDTYSTGMKKRLAILAVMKQNKPIVILDEPFNGLDIEMNKIMQLILSALKKNGKTIIITSHIIETLTGICDYIHLLQNGKIEYSVEKKEFPVFEKDISTSIKNTNYKLITELTR